jgi:signal transduction histidine kinase
MNPLTPLTKRVLLLGESFQTKLMLTMLLPLLVIWSVVAFTSGTMQERQKAFVGDLQEANAKRLADELNEKISDRFAMLAAIVSDLDTSHLADTDYATNILRHRPALGPMFSAGSVIFDRSGTALGDYPVVVGRKGANYADREFLQRLFATGKATISQPFEGRPSKGLRISMCVPIVGEGEEVRGALCGNFDMKTENFLGRLTDPQSMGKNSFFLIRTGDRVLVASTDGGRVMSQMPDTRLLHQLMAGSGKTFVATNAAGVEKLYASVPVAVAGWVLALGLPTDIAYGPIRTVVSELKRATLAASLLVILAAFFLAKRMLRPLQRAGDRMDAMSSGREPLQRVDETADTEVSRLLTSFNRLSESVSSQQTQLQSERNALVQAKDELRQLNMNLEARVGERTAELTAANGELESFAYAVSHDLRAPLRAMSGFSQALLEDYGETLDGQAKTYLDQISIASRRMGQLIEGILALSRVTRGDLLREPIDISALAERQLRELARIHPSRSVNWRVEPQLTAIGDIRTVEAVLSNLLGNAWKYTGRTEDAQIRVRAGILGEKPSICVTDNGAGFDMVHAEQLFKPFRRLHRQDEFVGIGIGLATVQRIVHRHGGTIHAEGTPNGGASFCFTLSSNLSGVAT